MQFDAQSPDVDFVQCAVCENGITGGRWFARMAHGEWMVALCCPLCLEVVREEPDTLHQADRNTRANAQGFRRSISVHPPSWDCQRLIRSKQFLFSGTASEDPKYLWKPPCGPTQPNGT